MSFTAIPKLKSRFRRFHALRQNVGLAYALQNVVVAIVPRSVFDMNMVEVHAQRLDDPKLGGDTLAGLRWLAPEDLPAMHAFDPNADDLEQRFAAGAFGAGLFDGDRIVGWRWFQPRFFDQFDWLRFRFGQRSVWGFGGLIDPDRRGQGIFGKLTDFAGQDLTGRGVEQVLALSFSLNTSAVRAKEKTGASLVLKMRWFRLFNATLVTTNRRHKVGFWHKDRPFVVDLGDLTP